MCTVGVSHWLVVWELSACLGLPLAARQPLPPLFFCGWSEKRHLLCAMDDQAGLGVYGESRFSLLSTA